ncbi:MAG: hypothetical protein Q4C54_04215 [Clostridia bacterium]|nr:hypothetical protein [Clostridia bacterium]
MIALPGVKIDRRQFLAETFANDNVDLERLLEDGPVESGCSRELLKKKASAIVFSLTSISSVASFATGIPGGLAMAVSIPADITQFFGIALRMAQELVYLYGGKDFWQDGFVDE